MKRLDNPRKKIYLVKLRTLNYSLLNRRSSAMHPVERVCFTTVVSRFFSEGSICFCIHIFYRSILQLNQVSLRMMYIDMEQACNNYINITSSQDKSARHNYFSLCRYQLLYQSHFLKPYAYTKGPG